MRKVLEGMGLEVIGAPLWHGCAVAPYKFYTHYHIEHKYETFERACPNYGQFGYSTFGPQNHEE